MTDIVKKKRAKPFAANAHTVNYLRGRGWYAANVEKVIPGCFQKRDLMGIIDVIAWPMLDQETLESAHRGVLGVQATSGGGSKGQSNGLARRRKLLESPEAKAFVQAGNTLWLCVWKPGVVGKKTMWYPDVEVLDIDSFVEGEQ